MSRQTINLDDDHWTFGQVPRRHFAAVDVYDLPAVGEWLPATVPGNVRPDLLAQGRIPDPFVAEDYRHSLWVEEVDWWYRRELTFDALDARQRVFVAFGGIDYLTAIFLDGQEVGRYEGMFARRVIELTQFLPATHQKVELAVRIWGSGALPRRRLNWLQRRWAQLAGKLHGSWVGVYPDRSATLKGQMSFGWDFAPPIRTMGLWDDVQLITTGPAAILEASAIGHPTLESPAADSADTEFRIDLTLDSRRADRVQAVVSIEPANFSGDSIERFYFSLDLSPGQTQQTLSCPVSQAKLWQPWDRGQPHLYNVTVAVTGSTGQVSDQVVVRTGVRRVELKNWQFFINDRLEFMRGLNWVPADSFPGRVRRSDYEALLTLARDSGANMLRVWGGGLREKQAFYDLCDELGLLVWQEFPFACMFLGNFPRRAGYLALVEAECSAIVRQTRHHPAVIAWCGGNEFSQLRNRPLLKILAALVEQHDGSRPFIPTSPGHTAQGRDAHNWHVWHGDAPIQAYQAETASFLSEFGLQALPHPDTLTAALPDPTSPAHWPTHHADLQKLTRYLSPFLPQSPISQSPNPPSPISQSPNPPSPNLPSPISPSPNPPSPISQPPSPIPPSPHLQSPISPSPHLPISPSPTSKRSSPPPNKPRPPASKPPSSIYAGEKASPTNPPAASASGNSTNPGRPSVGPSSITSGGPSWPMSSYRIGTVLC